MGQAFAQSAILLLRRGALKTRFAGGQRLQGVIEGSRRLDSPIGLSLGFQGVEIGLKAGCAVFRKMKRSWR